MRTISRISKQFLASDRSSILIEVLEVKDIGEKIENPIPRS